MTTTELILAHVAYVVVFAAICRVVAAKRARVPLWVRAFVVGGLTTGGVAFLTWLDPHPRSSLTAVLALGVAGVLAPRETVAPIVDVIGRGSFRLFAFSALLLGVIVLVHTPAVAFLSSPEEFALPVGKWLVPNLILFMKVLYGVLLAYAFFVSPRLTATLTVTMVVVSVLTFLYAYVLPFGYPMMAGLSFERSLIDSDTAFTRLCGDIVIGGVVTALVVAGLQRWGARPATALVVSMTLALAGISAARLLAFEKASPIAIGEVGASETPYVYSSEKENVLIIFLDRFMGGFVEQILKDEPELIDRLDGFSWFPNTIAAGRNTIAGMPPVFGGYDYLPQEINKRKLPLVDVSTEAYQLLPRNFAKKGYGVNFVDPRGLGFTMEGDCNLLNSIDGVKCSHTPSSVPARWAKRLKLPVVHKTLPTSSYLFILRRLGGMRSFPYFLKGALYNDGKWQPSMQHSAGVTLREWAEVKALSEMTVVRDGPGQLNVVWSILPHEPEFLGLDCKPKKRRLTKSKKKLKKAGYTGLREYQHYHGARCTLKLVAEYFDTLRKRKVYDQTRIVIVSDHGVYGGVRDRSSRAIAGGTQHKDYVSSRSVLWVKPENARGPMKTDETYTPNAEVPRIVCEQIGGCVNPFLNNKTIEAHGRDDPWFITFVPWQFSRQKENAFKVIKQIKLTGKAPYEKKNWKR